MEWRSLRRSSLGAGGTAPGAFDFEEKSVQEDQSVSQMVQEVLMRQAKVLTQRSGYSLEEARQSVSDTEAGRQLRELANGEHRYVKAQAWQASVFWERAEQRLMHDIGSEALSRFVAERHSTRG
jgi:hypothetical protein